MKRKIFCLAMSALALSLAACGSGSGGTQTPTKALGSFRFAQSCEEIRSYARGYAERVKNFPDRVIPVAEPFAAPAAPTAGGAPEAADDAAQGGAVLQSDLAFPDAARGLLYALGRDKKSLKVFRVSPIAAPQLLASLELDFYPAEAVALQAGGRAFVALFGSTEGGYYYGDGPVPLPAQTVVAPEIYPNLVEPKSVMALVEVTQPEQPRLLREEQSLGYFLEARALTGAGKILWVTERHVPIYLEELKDEQILPNKSWRGSLGEGQGPVVDCTQVYLYENPSLDPAYSPGSLNAAVVSILDLNESGAEVRSQAIYSPAWRTLIAANPERLFLAQNVDFGEGLGSELYQFELGSGPSLLAISAATSVPGNIPNQFFLDEKDGVLRVFHHVQNFSPICMDDCVAVGAPGAAEGGAPGAAMKAQQAEAAGNYLSTYRKVGEKLELLGRSGPFEADEVPYAARFVGGLGCVITFLQIDPLTCFDLKDPAHPLKLGELEIEGVSFHLEAITDTLLLGIGQGGANGSVVANLFDIRDPSRPKLARQRVLSGPGEWAYSPVFHDHRALGQDPTRRHFAVPFEDASGSTLALFSVDPTTLQIGALGDLHKPFTEQGPYDSFLRAYFFADGLATLSSEKLEVFAREGLAPVFASPLGE